MRCQEHVRLPQALNELEAGVAGEAGQCTEHCALVAQRDTLVVREPFPGSRRQGIRRLVADANHGRTRARQASGEERHLDGIARGNHDDVHSASTSSTRIRETMRVSASRTTAVSGGGP